MTEQEAEAKVYAKIINIPARTVLRYFKAHGIVSLRDIRARFTRPGFVHEDMHKAIEDWVLT